MDLVLQEDCRINLKRNEKKKKVEGILLLYSDSLHFKKGKETLCEYKLGNILGVKAKQEESFAIWTFETKVKKQLKSYIPVQMTVTFKSNNATKTRQQWVSKIKAGLLSRRRQKRLLILLNPKSGPGKARSIFERFVVPVLKALDVDYDLVVTQRRFHGRDLIADPQNNLRRWCGALIVSGDGLLYEVIQGLFARSDWEFARHFPIGIIPGGSGNGLAHSLIYLNGESPTRYPAYSSALNLKSGGTTAMDVTCVRGDSGKVYYSFLSIGWGLMADIDIESERLRFMGEPRFLLWSLFRICKKQAYRGVLKYLPVEKQEDIIRPDTSWNEEAEEMINNAENTWVEPKMSKENLSWSEKALNVPSEQLLPFDSSESDWKIMEGKFVMVYACSQCKIGSNLLVAPESRLADGTLWILVLKEGISRKALIKYLLDIEEGKMDMTNPCIQLLQVKAFVLKPIDSGILTIDGEPVASETIQAQVLPSYLNIMNKTEF